MTENQNEMESVVVPIIAFLIGCGWILIGEPVAIWLIEKIVLGG